MRIASSRFLRSALAIAAVLIVTAGAPSAEGQYGPDPGRYAWETVRRDPCLWHAYVHFADRHRNSRKRWHFVLELAHEGCPDRAYCPDHGPHPYAGRAYHGHRRWSYDDDSSDDDSSDD